MSLTKLTAQWLYEFVLLRGRNAYQDVASISCGGLADVGFGWLRDHQVPLNLIFGGFAAVACLSAWLVLRIRTTDDDRA